MEGKIDLAIPATHTERLIPAPRMQNAVYETENQDAYISLPVLFKLKTEAPHGLVLKSAGAIKTTLLTPRIERDIEIPDDSIHELPKAFSGLFQYFKGAYVDDQSVILILDPEKLVAGIK